MSQVYTRITKRSHPGTFRAFLKIDYDHGAVNRYEPEAQYYDVPEPFLPLLAKSESPLGELSDEELETFTCGEESEAMALITSGRIPIESHKLLNGYFNGWDTVGVL